MKVGPIQRTAPIPPPKSSGDSFADHMYRARREVCAGCGGAVATYQRGLCKQCLAPELERGRALIDIYRRTT